MLFKLLNLNSDFALILTQLWTTQRCGFPPRYASHTKKCRGGGVGNNRLTASFTSSRVLKAEANVNPVALDNFSSVQKARLFFVVALVLSGPWLVNESICKKSSLGNIANLFLSEFKLVPRVNKKHLVSTLAWANVFPCYCSQSRGFWASRVAKPRATAFRSPLLMIVPPYWRTRRSWGPGWDRSAKFKFSVLLFAF